MKFLFEMTHPADVLFFYHPIRILRERDHFIQIASRRKDVTTDLLDAFKLPHVPISTAAQGVVGLASELMRRDYALTRLARRCSPDVIAAFGGVCASHVGRLLRCPAVVFYDTETARLQSLLTNPFVAELHVPACYTGPEARRRTKRFDGYKELSYLHPENFKASREIAERMGLDPTRDNLFVRVVAWNANHDIRKHGWSADLLTRLVAKLSAIGKVHISSEGPPVPGLMAHHLEADPHLVHHLLAFCRLYVGESATMCAEAAVLGVPGIFAAPFDLGYMREFELSGLVKTIPEPGLEALSGAAADMLRTPPEVWTSKRDTLIRNKINVAHYVVDVLERWAERRK